jgi:hypothetical protein
MTARTHKKRMTRGGGTMHPAKVDVAELVDSTCPPSPADMDRPKRSVVRGCELPGWPGVGG